MRYQLGQAWSVGAVLIPAGTIINLNKDDHDELTTWEQIAKGKIPLVDCVALDADAAVVLWLAYRHCRSKLRRSLGKYAEQLYQQIISDPLLIRYWQSKPTPQQPTKPKFDFATELNLAIQREKEKAHVNRP